jgi:hypothetical protein
MAEKRVIELEVTTNEKSLKAQLREAQAEVQKLAEKFGATSQQAVQAAKKAAELKDAIGDAKDLTDAYNPDAKFNALSKSIGGVLNGFQAYEGALGLIGIESESVQRTLLKVQSAMALSQGIQGIFEAKDSFKQLGSVIRDTAIKLGILTVVKEEDTVATVANTVALEAQAAATGDASVGFKNMGKSAKVSLNGIKGAIAATGIGLLVIALGALVAYWDDIKAAVGGVSLEQEELNKKVEKNVLAENEKLTALNSQDNVLKLQGLSERQILQLKIKQIDLTIAATEEQIKQNIITQKAQEEAVLRNYEIAKQVIATITKIALFPVTAMIAQIDLLVKGANYVSEALGGKKLIDLEPLKEANKFFDKMAEGGAKLLFDPEQVKEDGEKVRKENEKQLTELKNTKAGYQLAIQQLDSQGSQTAIDTKKAELDALIELEIKKAQTDEKILTDLLNKRLELENLSGAQLELAKQNNADKIREAIAADNKEQIHLETKKLEKLKILGDSRTETLKGQINAEVEAKRQAAELEIKILEAKAVRARKIDEQANSFKVKSVQQGLEIISSLTELFGKKGEKAAKKAFQVNKAAQIAQATINTYQSATGAYASQMALATPDAPIRAAVAAGIAIATGLANVAKIASQKFEGGSSGGGGSAPSAAGGGVVTPNFNVIGSSGVNQLAQIQQQPTRAYVVSGDVANGLSLERNRLQNASF